MGATYEIRGSITLTDSRPAREAAEHLRRELDGINYKVEERDNAFEISLDGSQHCAWDWPDIVASRLSALASHTLCPALFQVRTGSQDWENVWIGRQEEVLRAQAAFAAEEAGRAIVGVSNDDLKKIVMEQVVFDEGDIITFRKRGGKPMKTKMERMDRSGDMVVLVPMS